MTVHMSRAFNNNSKKSRVFLININQNNHNYFRHLKCIYDQQGISPHVFLIHSNVNKSVDYEKSNFIIATSFDQRLDTK